MTAVATGTKCCYAHWAARNRSERRRADRACKCRGECGCRTSLVLRRMPQDREEEA